MSEFDEGKPIKPKQDYDVGYRRPPAKTQFKPGQSGNPEGRKRKPKSVQDQMQAVVYRKISINEGGKQRRLPVLEVIFRMAANMALKGNLKAMELVLKLLNSPEYADAATLDGASLSPDENAMLGEIIRQFTEAGDADQPAFSGSDDVENTVNEASANPEEGSPQTSNAAKEDGDHGD